MDGSQKTVFFDDEVASQILAIIREAQKYAVIVTPYLQLWGHAQEALVLAVKKHVDVTAIIRLEPDILESEDVTWLKNIGIKVLVAQYLHAKIYMNEHAIVVGSMNLTEFSTKNSLEIALVVRDEQEKRRIREYVTNRLMRLAMPVSSVGAAFAHQPIDRGPQPGLRALAGVCIRCRRPVPFDSFRPLCSDCYDVWAAWGNDDYPEVFCHSCGKPSDVAYARPLCQACFRKYH